MGILDEAIREHLELKRQHGAGDSELQQLEDEAFGQADRPGDEQAPDPMAEAPTQFMEQPEIAEDESARREPTIADLQEPPPLPEPKQTAVVEDVAEPEPAPVDEAPAEEEQPAMEHEIVADAVEASGPSTEERQTIAEQPTEMFDVEQELGGPPSPTDEELVEEEIAEPRLAPTDPLAGLAETEEAEVSVQGPAPDDDDEYDDEDDAFWNEQRLSDELDQALEAPRDDEPEPEPEPAAEVEIETELEEQAEPDEEPESEEYEAPETAEELAPVAESEPESAHHEEDVLEETPDFLEETPEDDQLWFEQKPPKDFDFDD
jgi:pilus assembly protein FimV